MKQEKRTKILLITFLIVALGGIPIIINNLKSGGDTDSALYSTSGESLSDFSGVTADLNRINSVTLDTTMLDDKAFSYLHDFTISLPPIPVGRVNPFASF